MIIHNNVKSYTLIEDLWQITFNNIEDHPEKEIQPYFIMSREYISDAFFHWVFEDCIYIEEYYKLKNEIPNLKIHIGNNRDFKRIFLKYLQVNPEDIVCNLEPINICYFPDTLHINSITKCKKYFDRTNNILDKYISYFAPQKKEDIQKTIPILYLPRQNKENFIGSNRYYITQEIEKLILLLDDRNKILNTDTITDLNDQINMIRSSYLIFVTDGSAALVNSSFAYNSHVIILGNYLMTIQCRDNLYFKLLMDKNKSRNLSLDYISECSPLAFNIKEVFQCIYNKFSPPNISN